MRTPPHLLAEIFGTLRAPDMTPRFNIAPTQAIGVVRAGDQVRDFTMMRWGLVPSWSKDPKAGPPLVNARADTIATKPAFRSAFKRRRCLIPADGFYEWKKIDAKTKQPFHIGLAQNGPFAFAGIWERWEGADATVVESCSIVTTDANELMATIHNRQPVILEDEHWDCWLDPKLEGGEDLARLMQPLAADRMHAFPISTYVNNVRNQGPECIAPRSELE